jgi:hypothetical protein
MRAALQQEESPPRALILSSAVAGADPEALEAILGGLEPHFVTPGQWRTLTAAQFKEYQALLIGAGGCEEGALSALQAANDNREVWGAIVDGNVFLTAAMPDKDNASQHLKDGVEFAGSERGKTGLYLSLGCGYESATALLEPFGVFTVEGLSCRADEPCEASAVFTRYPDRTFSPVAITRNSQGVGAPYALTRQAAEEAPPAMGSPPVARCANVSVRAVDTCGFHLSIDNGSYDPDGDLVDCTQSPAGPYGAGMTGVTLTCRDAANRVGTCSGMVTVFDENAPTVSLLGEPTVGQECGLPYTDPGVTAYDVCEGDISHRVPLPRINTQWPGSHTVGISVTDTAGNRSSPVFRTIHVTDTRAPTLTVKGPLEDSYECGSTYVDPGATADDLCFGNLTASITVTRAGDASGRGPLQISYSVSDGAGNTTLSAVTRKVTVRDTQPPVLVLQGPGHAVLECGSGPYVDPGASASDVCAGDVTGRIARTGEVHDSTPGTYPLEYNVTDPAGNRAPPAVRVVEVVDTLPPTITVTGPTRQLHECGSPYQDPGASAVDMCQGYLPVETHGTVDPHQRGDYVLSYRATDPSGNTSVTPGRTVAVRDTLPPVISIPGPNPQMLECGTPYLEPQPTITDQCDKDGFTVVKTGAVNNRAPGSYVTHYSASDSSGNVGSASLTVNVTDTLPPVLTLHGPPQQRVECGMTYVDPGASANDTCAGDLTHAIVVTRTGSTQGPGTLRLAYSVTDPSGNTATASRTVETEDTLPPVLTLLGATNQAVECGTPYSDPGATAMDQCAGDVTASITRSGSVTTGTVGRYTLAYTATDPQGQRSPSATRTVDVADTQAPSIKLLGPASQTVPAGTSYSDPGATAADRCSGAVTVMISGSVNTSVPGTYTLHYTARDRAGNTSQTLTRTVTVTGAAESFASRSAEE